MRLPSVPTKAVVDHLNTIYFKNVWNATDDRGRSNFRLYKAAERLQTGAVPVGQSVVGLPTTDAVYAVYKTTYRGLSRYSSLPDDQWVTDTYLLEKFAVTLQVYSGEGRTYPTGKVYLRYIPILDTVLVAVDKQLTSKCIGASFPDLYMTFYKDTTRNTPVVSNTYIVSTLVGSTTSPSTVTTLVNQANNTYPNKTMVSVNGWIYHPTQIPTLVNNDVVNIISDPDIVGYCDINVDDNLTGYYSERYGEYREVLHVPKVLNPNNTIITTDSLTFVVIDTATNKGVLGQRVNPHAIESVTHNDFSVARTTIQSLSNALGASTVKIRLFVRLATNPNYLRSDVNRMKDLYSLPDTEIKAQLMGTADIQITEWQAQNVEKSKFIDLTYNFKSSLSSTIIEDFSEAVGYYDLASTLGQQMRFYTYKGAEVHIVKPARLYGYTCNAVVYANGLKVPETKFRISNYSDKTFTLGFTADSGVTIGDRIGVYIAEYDLREIISFNPTSVDKTIVLDNDDYELFEVKTFSSAVNVWEGSTTKGYKRVPKGSAEYSVEQNSDGTFTYTAKTKNLNKHFYCVPKYGMNNAVYEIDQVINDKDPVIINLEVSHNSTFIPMFGYTTLEAYLNGHRLVDGVDYEVKYTKDEDGYILQNVLCVSNNDYLNLEGGLNLLEVTIHGDIVVSEDKGYVFNNHLYRTAMPMIYAPSSSRVFVKGKLQEVVHESGNVLTTSTNTDNGAPYLHQCTLAYGATKLMDAISPSEEISLRGRIEHVLGIIPPDVPDTILIEHLHALHSPFLAKIVSDVGDEVISIVDEPRNDTFVKQFSHYSPILDRDPTIGNNAFVDRRFVSIAAHYTNYAVQDPEQMMRLQRLINLVLNPSELSIKEVLL